MQLTKSAKLGLWAFLVVDVALVVVFAVLLMVRQEREQLGELRELGVSFYPQPASLRDYQLTDHTGKAFGADRFSGRWSMVFFGFTSCPDICPLTMAELSQFYNTLESSPGSTLPQIVLVTLDPQRDSPAALASYLERFHEDFIGVTGSMNELSAFAGDLYVAFNLPGQDGHGSSHEAHPGAGQDTPGDGTGVAAPDRGTSSPGTSSQGTSSPGTTDSHYNIDHSGHISVVDPQGKVVAVLRQPHRDRDLLLAWPQIVGR